jgi:hypothetical protein
MLVHAIIAALYLFSSSYAYTSGPSAFARLSRPVARSFTSMLRKRGLIKRSQCVLGGSAPASKGGGGEITTVITTTVTDGGATKTQTQTQTQSLSQGASGADSSSQPQITGLPSSFKLDVDSYVVQSLSRVKSYARAVLGASSLTTLSSSPMPFVEPKSSP